MADTSMSIIDFDVEQLSAADIYWIEDYAQIKFADLIEQLGQLDVRVLVAVAFVGLRRTNPNVTIEEVEAMPLVELLGSVNAGKDESE